MSSYPGNNAPQDRAAAPVFGRAPEPQPQQLPQAPQFFNIAPSNTPQPQYVAPQQPMYEPPQQQYQQQYPAYPIDPQAMAPTAPHYQPVAAANAWQPRYVPSAPAASSSFVPPLARRDGVFGLAVGLFLIVLIFATALALQAKMPGYAPAAAANARPLGGVVAGGGALVGPAAPADTGKVRKPSYARPSYVRPQTNARAAGGPLHPAD